MANDQGPSGSALVLIGAALLVLFWWLGKDSKETTASKPAATQTMTPVPRPDPTLFNPWPRR